MAIAHGGDAEWDLELSRGTPRQGGGCQVKALIVVDVQNGVYQWEGSEVFAGQRTITTINELITRCRAGNNPVIFVQHEDEYLAPGSAPWELLSALDVRGDDALVSKRHGSAFQGTRLDESLRA